MKGMKKIIVALLAVLVLLVAALMGLMVVNDRNYMIDGRPYPKDAESLDLRGKDITLQHYETVCQVLPECEILWDVPLSGGAVASDSREAVVTDLEEFAALQGYFSNLEVLDITGCTDLSALPAVLEKLPELKLRFALTVDGDTYTQDSRELTLTDVGEVELVLLRSMTELEWVTVKEGGATAGIPALAEYCEENDIKTDAVLNGQTVSGELTLENVTEDRARLLMLASDLEKLHLVEPEAEAGTLLTLREVLPETDVTWEKTVMGLTFDSDDTEIDLTPVIALEDGQEPGKKTAYDYALDCEVMGKREENPGSGRLRNNYPIPDKFDQTEQLLAEVEAAMAYFPNAEKLMLYGAWLDNDRMAEFREEHRAEYKTVWTVRCGPLVTRTDATFFMPTKYQINYNAFTDLDAYNLRYCEDMVSIDIGHYIVANIDFAAFMPELRYLVLSWTVCNDLTPLTNCKKLEFFEINWIDRYIDYTPLQECTALKDLNISETGGDITPILEMTWLDNLWIVGFSEADYRETLKALPDTYVGFYYDNPINGWRTLPNYFAMRDAMLMFYMS
ncbi:MAG: hypothetical protein IJE81_00910 [Oscillospiraceae bacterium]|nr:hypothetical protein [Oscillospiraceae bacterium]